MKWVGSVGWDEMGGISRVGSVGWDEMGGEQKGGMKWEGIRMVG